MRGLISLTIAPAPFRVENFDNFFFVSIMGEGFLIFFVDLHKTRDTDILAMAFH